MRLIIRFMGRKDRLTALLVAAVVVAQVLLETRIPGIMARISDRLQQGTMDQAAIRAAGGEMLACAGGAFAAACVISFLIAGLGSRVCCALRKGIFRKMIGFSLPEISSLGTGTLISRCTDDVLSMQSFMSQCLLSLVQAPVMLVIIFLRVSATRPAWVLIAAGAVVLMAALIAYLFAAAIPLARRGSVFRDRMITVTREHIYGIREIHAGNHFKSQKQGYDEANRNIVGFNIRSKTLLSLFAPTATMLLSGVSVAVYLSGAQTMQGLDRAQQIADFSNLVAFVSYTSLLFSALVSIVLVIITVPHMLNAQRRILEVLNRENSIPEGKGVGDAAPERGTVEFRNVSFRYPGSSRDALTDISFRVRPGQTLAIIGGTGAGKTTVLNLIPRLYEASGGEVLVDGIPVKEYRLEELRNRIGYVPQVNYLFRGTIAGNIGYGHNGRFEATIREIRKAAEVGQADEFIRKKEHGYDDEVVAGGTNFSGGQRQRLTISRAVCRDPEIYLFDDSFSALDFRTDAALRRALRKTTEGSSVIVVGQRIATVRNADVILVMDSGRIVDQGTHEELLARCGVYREIAESQEDRENAG